MFRKMLLLFSLLFSTPVYAQDPAGEMTPDMWSDLFILVLIFLIFYFILFRPQAKKIKEHKAMVEALRRGDKVVTAGGIVAEVTKVEDDNRLEVEIAQGVRIKIVQSTVSDVLTPGKASQKEAANQNSANKKKK